MYTLRAAEANDTEFLFRLYASTREQELSVLPWSGQEKEAFLRWQFAAQDTHYRARYHGASLDVLLVAGAPAGRLYVSRRPREIRLMDIALLPAFRGHGIGERVLRDLCTEADRDGKVLSMHMESNNPARRLYERLGFRVVHQAEPGVYLRLERQPVN